MQHGIAFAGFSPPFLKKCLFKILDFPIKFQLAAYRVFYPFFTPFYQNTPGNKFERNRGMNTGQLQLVLTKHMRWKTGSDHSKVNNTCVRNLF